MIDLQSNYDNMHKDEMFYALVCINNHIVTCINCMLSILHPIYNFLEICSQGFISNN